MFVKYSNRMPNVDLITFGNYYCVKTYEVNDENKINVKLLTLGDIEFPGEIFTFFDVDGNPIEENTLIYIYKREKEIRENDKN